MACNSAGLFFNSAMTNRPPLVQNASGDLSHERKGNGKLNLFPKRHTQISVGNKTTLGEYSYQFATKKIDVAIKLKH